MIRNRIMLVVYDIADNKRRRELFKLMKSYGIRTQFSFFECLLSEKQEVTLRFRIMGIINPSEDKVGFIHVCDRCFKQVKRIGYAAPELFSKNDMIF